MRHDFAVSPDSGMRWNGYSLAQYGYIPIAGDKTGAETQVAIIAYSYLLIQNAAVNHGTAADESVPHNHGIPDYSPLIDPYLGRQYGILNMAFDDAPRTNQAIDDT